MSGLKDFIEQQIAIAVNFETRVCSKIKEYQQLMLKLRSITALEEKELISKVSKAGIDLNSLYHFYAYFGRFPSSSECIAIKEMGIYEFVQTCGM